MDLGLQAYIDQIPLPATLEQAIAERDAWIESAMQFSRNEGYYRGLVDEIAVTLGEAAYTAKDGSIYDSPVRAKVPELVSSRQAALVTALEPFARGAGGIEDVGRARRLICEVKGIKPATEPCAKVQNMTHG